MIEKVKIQELEEAWAQVLREQRDLDDAVARCENALLKYYKRTRENQEVVFTVLAA